MVFVVVNYKLILRLRSSWISLLSTFGYPRAISLSRKQLSVTSLITRLPLSPHFNPYNYNILEVFPDTHYPIIIRFCKYDFDNHLILDSFVISHAFTHDMHFFYFLRDFRRFIICHYNFPKILNYITAPTWAEEANYIKCFHAISRFLALPSYCVCD